MNKIHFQTIEITDFLHFEMPNEKNKCQLFVTLNSELFLISQTSEIFQKTLIDNRCRVTIDGQWILWALKYKYKRNDFKKFSGSDLIYDICFFCSSNSKRIMLLGSSKKNNSLAVNNLKEKYKSLMMEGYSPNIFDPISNEEKDIKEQKEILNFIKKFNPEYIITGLGAPKEQAWAMRNIDWLEEHGVKGVFFFGGAIDFASGNLKRAPTFIQKVGMEGVYRLFKQPSRLKRFVKTLDILKIILKKDY